MRTAEQVDLFVREARAVANLKHPGLVSVYDVQEWDGKWFIVQEYIDGKHLGDWSAEHQPHYATIASTFVAISEVACGGPPARSDPLRFETCQRADGRRGKPARCRFRIGRSRECPIDAKGREIRDPVHDGSRAGQGRRSSP